MPSDSLEWLMGWYAAQCDGEWEHAYGVKIDTLDNPGWSLRIDLTDSALQHLQFEEVRHQYDHDTDWWICRVEEGSFKGWGGTLQLPAMIEVFRRWVESVQTSVRSNTINVIAPYRYLGMWVFDDARVGLVQEPFVAGADTMIDRVVADLPDAEQGFTLLFSASPFPGHQLRLDWRRADNGGNWYYAAELDQEGWLCPALFRYFAEAPPELYVQVKAARP